jgi:DNA-binding MarR family transcriptional regulator
MVRRRNSFLQLLEFFRTVDSEIVVNDLLVFLYVCENEGLNVRELAALARLTEATASRRVRALAGPEIAFPVEPSMGLLEIYQGEDARERLLYLSDKGRQVAATVSRLIAEAAPLAEPSPALAKGARVAS